MSKPTLLSTELDSYALGEDIYNILGPVIEQVTPEELLPWDEAQKSTDLTATNAVYLVNRLAEAVILKANTRLENRHVEDSEARIDANIARAEQEIEAARAMLANRALPKILRPQLEGLINRKSQDITGLKKFKADEAWNRQRAAMEAVGAI